MNNHYWTARHSVTVSDVRDVVTTSEREGDVGEGYPLGNRILRSDC